MPKDFFISYNKADRDWAEWVAFVLEESDQYSTAIQAWDFRPGGNFVIDMQQALVDSERTIMILSVDYLSSLFTQPEWATAFRADPTGVHRQLVPVRVGPCEPPGLLAPLVYIDLLDLALTDARKVLLDGVRQGRVKPANEPLFPGSKRAAPETRDPRAAARKVIDLLTTTRVTFIAQSKLRDELYTALSRRLGVPAGLEYERFFARFFPSLTADERQIHDTIRSYTADVLMPYNAEVLQLLDEDADLSRAVNGIAELRRHLVLWMAKAKGAFRSNPAMSLVYVGVEEGVPFPKDVEKNLDAFVGDANSDRTRSEQVRESLNEPALRQMITERFSER